MLNSILMKLFTLHCRPLDIEFEDDEEDEDKIIEQRRKQREELLKVSIRNLHLKRLCRQFS